MNRIRIFGILFAVAISLVIAGRVVASRPPETNNAGAVAPVTMESAAQSAPGAMAPAPDRPLERAELAQPAAKPTTGPPGGGWPGRLGGTTAPRPVRLPPGSKAKAKPYVQPFAEQPGVRPLTRKPSPQAPMRIAPSMDGCDHNYGSRIQCVPWTFPAGVTDKCAWLTQHGYTGLPVVGTDRQKLDPDGNRVACA